MDGFLSNSKTIVLAAVCIFVGACGGGGSSSTPSSTPAVAPSPILTATPPPTSTATPPPASTATPPPASTAMPPPTSTATPTPVSTVTPSPIPTATPEVNSSPANIEPSASNVQITGDNNEVAIVGNSLIVSYAYADPENDEEGDSLIQWYRDGTAINGAMTAEYLVTSEDTGTDLNVGITPIAESGVETGSEAFSSNINIQNSAPSASNIIVIDSNGGALQIWDTLSASYAFSDPDLDQEGETRFRWLRGGSELVGSESTYTLQLADNGQTILLEITPVSVNDGLEGNSVVSLTYSITDADYVPSMFNFDNESNATIGQYSISKGITVSGIDIETPISVENGEYRVNGGEFTNASSRVSLDDSVEVRLIPTIPLGSDTIATLTIGGVAADYLVSSQTSNSAPYWESFEFSDSPLKIINYEYDIGSIAHADFDRDGNEDIIVAPYESGQLLWLENNGSNTPDFTQHVIPVSYSRALHVVSEDLDKDGDVDVVAYFSVDHVIAWYENDGEEQPSFTEHEIPLNSVYLSALKIADLDSDGDKDIVFVGEHLYWLKNDGLSFTEEEIPTDATTTGAVSLVVDYINEDAHLDIVFANYDILFGPDAFPNVYVMVNNGVAEPSFTETRFTGWANSAYLYFSSGDFDNDGDVDIVGSVPEDKRVVWYENTFEQNQDFNNRLINSSHSGGRYIYSFETKDIDGDGDLDFATTQPADNKIVFFENRELDFWENAIDNIPAAIDIEIVDLNSDGNNNLLTISYEEKAIYWTPIKAIAQYVSAGKSITFSVPVNDADNNTISYTVTGDDAGYIVLDSETGVFSFSNAPDFNSPLDENGDNVYEMFVNASDGITSIQRPIRIHVLDATIDTDGDGVLNGDDAYPNNPELKSLADTNAAPYWLSFEVSDTPESLFSFSGHLSSLRYADLNNNGHQDLIASSAEDNRLVWLENDGSLSPVFTHNEIATSLVGPGWITPVDFDSDLDVDFVVYFSDSNSFAWYENSGSTSPDFTEHLISSIIPSGLHDLEIKDLDNDSDLDIIFTDQNGLVWLENSGDDATFSYQIIRGGITLAYYLEVDYFDRDDHLDIAVSVIEGGSFSRAEITLYINSGAVDPVFTEGTLAGWGGDADIVSFTAVDINHDGDLDIFGSRPGGGRVGWYESNPPCFCFFDFYEFDSSHERHVGNLSAADIDGDGDIDFSAPHRLSNQIVFYENDNLDFSERIVASDLSPGAVFPVDLNSDGSSNFIFGLEGSASWLPPMENKYYISEGESLNLYFLANDTDQDPIAYSVEGEDSHLFSVDPDFGVVSIVDIPPFYFPEDSDLNNIYNFSIIASDGIESIVKKVSVHVLQQGIDADGDGILNENDAFPNDASETQDNDGDRIGDNADTDDDNDLVNDTFDNAPFIASSYSQPEWDRIPDVLEKITMFEFSEQPSSVQVTDINADGLPDVLVASSNDNAIHVFLNRGENPVQFSHESIIFASAFFMDVIDLDGDGDKDIVSTSTLGRISWFINNGDSIPSFTEHVVDADAPGQLTVFSIDIDGDLDIDIISIGQDVNIYRSNGAVIPMFTEESSDSLSLAAFLSSPADFDLDGDIDFASASVNTKTVTWLESDGESVPQYTVHSSIESPRFTSNAAFFALTGDINRDGYPDIISGPGYYYQFQWLENSGRSGERFLRKSISSVYDDSFPVNLVDIDDDGDLDIVTTSSRSIGLSVQVNDGKSSPSFSEQVLSRDSGGGFFAAVGDINVDGHKDFVTIFSDPDPSKGGAVYWYPKRHRYIGVMEGQSWSFTESATDEDGDTLVYSISGSDSSFYEVDSVTGQLTFANAPSYTTPLDANGDNVYDIEISVTDGFSSRTRLISVRVLEFGSDYDNDGTVNEVDELPLQSDENLDTDGDRIGNNSDEDDDNDGTVDRADNAPLHASSAVRPTWIDSVSFRSIILPEYSDSPSSVAIEDLDGDGDEDIIVSSYDSQTLHWLENDGADTPAYTKRLIAENSRTSNVKTADMDGDGHGDIVVSNYSSSGATLVWYENDGETPPSFSPHTISELGYPAVFSIGDIDSDDDLDIISTFYRGAKTIYLYENNGQPLPEFSEEDLNVAERSWYGVDIADVNNDGYMDFVANTNRSSSVSWFENNGETVPTFSETQILSLSGGGLSPIFTVDLNGDNSLDILSSAVGSSSFYHLKNDTLIEPSFTSVGHTTFIADESPTTVIDYNFDGRMDILTVSRDSGVVNLLVNRDYGFGPTLGPISGTTPLFAEAYSPMPPQVGDLNSDGILDIVVPDQAGNRIFILNQPHFSVPEGQLDVASISAEDADGNIIIYSIIGGNDSDLFSVDETGQLSFIQAPSYGSPLDHDGNNVYDLRVEASDGYSYTLRTVFVKVTL